ncbi:hypothetical protein [Paenibacillus sp. N3.4]|uniref:hypothetical protein n=1 Tax=Paenibacillus sp. N3.4 TaxID=2603222 RepID=UPI0011CAEC0B|nr:hypothetical protein [Paenibacillus sp. N3.4]TXK80990.1 hypothetical protein FU659_17015 [Paenibacillus sp. N3.4]
MSNVMLRPMGIGRILDRSFLLYRKYFVTLMLIMLILYGPFYLLQHLLTYQETAAVTTTSLLDQIRSGSSWQDILESGSFIQNRPSTADVWKMMVLVIVLVPVFILGLMPVSVAAVVHLVRASLFGEEIPGVGQLLKKSFRRFWPLVGSTLLDLLIIFGLYIGIIIIFFIIAFVLSIGGIISNSIGGFGAGAAVFAIIFGILIGLGFIIGLSYFIIRWCYYLPIVALGENPIGLNGSWRLTRNNFWRLFLMFFVFILIVYLFLGVSQLIIAAVFGLGLWSQLLQSLLSILVAPLWILPYAISFFDLKVRNEGLGLESLIQNTIYPSSSEPKEELEPFDPFDDPRPIDLDKKNE